MWQQWLTNSTTENPDGPLGLLVRSTTRETTLLKRSMAYLVFAAAVVLGLPPANAQAATTMTSVLCKNHRTTPTAGRYLAGREEARAMDACAQVYQSSSALKFFHNHRWMLSPRYDKWWQVPGEKRRPMARKARALVRWHVKRLRKLENQLIETLYVGSVSDWSCIHRHERHPRQGWHTNTGNGYYGGLQMDRDFMRSYGPEFLVVYGTADKWPRKVQMAVAQRAKSAGRGYYPWPETARMCGLI